MNNQQTRKLTSIGNTLVKLSKEVDDLAESATLEKLAQTIDFMVVNQ